MKKILSILVLNSLLILPSCSVYLENDGEVYNEYTTKYKESDTLHFQTPQPTIKIDSAIIGQQKYKPNSDHFYLPVKELGAGKQHLEVELYLSNGKRKCISKELMIVSSTVPKEVKIEQFIETIHDKKLYTQGLEFYNGDMYESAGLYNVSSLSKIDKDSGEKLNSINLDKAYFAEGLTFINDTIYLLTWKENQLLKFDNHLNLLEMLEYPYEGWGLCWTGKDLVASDGSQNLYFLDPHNLSLRRELQVYDDKGIVPQLNEMEWINGYIWANVYGQSYIAVINPDSGRVVYQINFSDTIEERDLWSKGVFNGIAYNKGKVYITGKNWPYYFVWEIPNYLKK